MSIPTTYDITHSCGHSESRDLSDVPAGQRAGKVAWWSEKPCFTCFRAKNRRTLSKEVQAERDAKHEDALADQERSGLPILRGSDKQVKWAIDTRYDLLRGAYTDLVEEGELDEAGFEEQVLELARRIDLAKWWIDNREATSSMLLELLADPGVDAGVNENPY